MTDLTVGERRYAKLVDQIVEQCQAIENTNLKRYHKIGNFVSEFLNGQDRAKYGTATIASLGEDLQTRGVLDEKADAKRFLYWSKKLYDRYQDLGALEELSRRGFKVIHAKLLFALDDDFLEDVESRMIQDGKVISGRALEALIKERGTALNIERAKAAAAAMVESRGGATPIVSESTEDDGDAFTPLDEDGDPIVEEEEDTSATTVSVAPSTKERTRSAPKVLSRIEKDLMKITADIPEVFIVLREAQQIGYDSDTAHKKYLEKLQAVKATAKAVLEPLETFIKEAESELDAASMGV